MRANLAIPVETRQEQEQQDIDEGLLPGEHTGEKAELRIRGRWHSMTIGEQFPDGDYLCIFDSTGNDIKVPLRQLRRQADLPLLKRAKGGGGQ